MLPGRGGTTRHIRTSPHLQQPMDLPWPVRSPIAESRLSFGSAPHRHLMLLTKHVPRDSSMRNDRRAKDLEMANAILLRVRHWEGEEDSDDRRAATAPPPAAALPQRWCKKADAPPAGCWQVLQVRVRSAAVAAAAARCRCRCCCGGAES